MAQKTLSAGFSPKRRARAARSAPHIVAVVAFDGFVLGDLAVPCEVFGRARGPTGRPFYEVRICSAAPEVVSEHAKLKTRWRLGCLARAGTVLVPGVDDLSRPIDPAVLRAIRRAADRGVRVASICTGAFLLASTGLLDGLRATTHWLAAAELARRYPTVEVDPNVLYIDNGALLTSAGAMAGVDLCLHLVRRDLGARVAADVAREGVMPLERTGGQAQYIAHDSPPPAGASLGPLLDWLERNLSRNLSLPVIARRAAMSTRTLSRRFREQAGITPAHWVARARVRRAQVLLETTDLSVEQVAAEVGLGSSAVLRERFGKVVGTSPQAYRRAFQGPRRSRA